MERVTKFVELRPQQNWRSTACELLCCCTRQVHIVGQSLGANVALKLAAAAPHQVKSVTILGEWPGGRVGRPAGRRAGEALLRAREAWRALCVVRLGAEVSSGNGGQSVLLHSAGQARATVPGVQLIEGICRLGGAWQRGGNCPPATLSCLLHSAAPAGGVLRGMQMWWTGWRIAPMLGAQVSTLPPKTSRVPHMLSTPMMPSSLYFNSPALQHCAAGRRWPAHATWTAHIMASCTDA